MKHLSLIAFAALLFAGCYDMAPTSYESGEFDLVSVIYQPGPGCTPAAILENKRCVCAIDPGDTTLIQVTSGAALKAQFARCGIPVERFAAAEYGLVWTIK